MQIKLPVRLFALPAYVEFPARDGREASAAWSTTVLLGADAVKFYSDSDPSEPLNGLRTKLEEGTMIDCLAVVDLYPKGRGQSGLGVSLQYFEAPDPIVKKS